jgi:hypothetical protein
VRRRHVLEGPTGSTIVGRTNGHHSLRRHKPRSVIQTISRVILLMFITHKLRRGCCIESGRSRETTGRLKRKRIEVDSECCPDDEKHFQDLHEPVDGQPPVVEMQTLMLMNGAC